MMSPLLIRVRANGTEVKLTHVTERNVAKKMRDQVGIDFSFIFD